MKTTPRRRLTATLIACAICFAPMSSFAQSDNQDAELGMLTTSYLSIIYLPFILAAVGAMLTTAGGVVITTTTLQNNDKEKKQRDSFAMLLDNYMSEHPEEWCETVSLGGGLLIEDVSGVLALRPEERGPFGAALRQQRQPMLALLDAPRGLERGHQAVDLLLHARATISAQ